MTLTLQDLVAPTPVDTFVEQHLLAGRHHLSAPNVDIVGRLLEMPALRDWEQLLQRVERVQLFGPGGFRSFVPGRVALDFYRRGDTLYLSDFDRHAPEILEAFSPVMAAFGISPQTCGIELFAARPQAISTLHYDQDTNFQILLRGTKRWHLAPNRHIVNPLLPNHRLASPKEEALADRLPLPLGVHDVDDTTELVAHAGSCMFFPVGYWHEVTTLEDSLSVNLALRADCWIDTIAAIVRKSLAAQAPLRAPALGALPGCHEMIRRHAARACAEGAAAWREALAALTIDDLALAGEHTAMRWSRTIERSLLETPDGARVVCGADSSVDVDVELVPAVRRLLQFRGSFTAQDLKTLEPSVATPKLLRLVRQLADRGFVEAA